jgi:RIO-like serine/threonine protein kinase
MKLISDNSVSKVWREDDWVYKRQPKFLTDNEWYALRLLADTGLVPEAEKVDISTVRLRYVKNESVTDAASFMSHYRDVLATLETHKIRHGDLTCFSVLVKDNKPILIDWAESRYWDDPRPDKRREGDAYWLDKTMRELCGS